MYSPDRDTVTFIANYMNENHQGLLVEIAVANGFGCDCAAIYDLTSQELILDCIKDGEAFKAPIRWPAQLQTREDVRRFLQMMQDDARFK